MNPDLQDASKIIDELIKNRGDVILTRNSMEGFQTYNNGDGKKQEIIKSNIAYIANASRRNIRVCTDYQNTFSKTFAADDNTLDFEQMSNVEEGPSLQKKERRKDIKQINNTNTLPKLHTDGFQNKTNHMRTPSNMSKKARFGKTDKFFKGPDVIMKNNEKN